MLESLQYPQRLHAALVHLPIGAAIFGLVLVMALAISRGRSNGLRWATVAVYLLGMGAAFLAEDAGKDAAGMLTSAGAHRTAEARALLHQHAEMGEAVWIFFLVAAVLTAATWLPWRVLRRASVVLALASGLAVASWVGVTGFYGGELVYAHGVGVPTSANNLPVTRTPAQETAAPATDAQAPSNGGIATPPATQP